MQPPQRELEPQPPPEVRVGLLLPLTGPAAELAQDMLDAAQMALFDVGANDLILLPRDTAGTPDGARQAAEQVIAEGAAVILGPLFNQAVSAVSPIAAAGRRPRAGVLQRRLGGAPTAPSCSASVRRSRSSGSCATRSRTSSGGRRGAGGGRSGRRGARCRRRSISRPVRIAGLAPDDAYGATAHGGAAPRGARGRRRARPDPVLSARPGRPLGRGPPDRGLRPAQGGARARARAARGSWTTRTSRQALRRLETRGHPRPAAVRCDPDRRRRRSPALGRLAADLLRRRSGGGALPRHDALAGRSAGAAGGGAAAAAGSRPRRRRAWRSSSSASTPSMAARRSSSRRSPTTPRRSR